MEHVHPARSPLVLREDNAPPPILFDDLAFEILSRLPVKSLVRFKCVCQYWKSFISNSNFIKEHLHKSRKNSFLISNSRLLGDTKFAQYSCSVSSSVKNPSPIGITEDLYIPYALQEYYDIVGTCNGLGCLVRSTYTTLEICVWNPATRLVSEKLICLLDIKRHPCYYPIFGFGYDKLTDTYKVVVAVLDVLAKEDLEVKVYSLGENCWRNIQNFPFIERILNRSGVYLNGTLNWMLLACHFNSNQFENWFIVSLDMGKETHTQLLPPCDLEEFHYEKSILEVFMDCLCLSHGYKGTHLVVWQMKEFGVQKSWTRLLNVSFQDIPIHDMQNASFSPLRMYENGDILIMVSFCNMIILYNPRDNRAEPIITSNYPSYIKVFDYVQSLVSPS